MLSWRLSMATVLMTILSAGCGGSLAPGDAMVRKGFQAFQEQEFRKAAELFEKADETGIKRVRKTDLYSSIGNCYAELQEYETALAWHRKAVEEDSKSYKAWVNLGIVHRIQGDYEEAAACYKKALAINPDYAELHASRGALFIVQNELDKAIDALETAVKLEPKLAIAHSNLAQAHALKGEFEKADKLVDTAIGLGYANGETLRERIDDLRKSDKKKNAAK